MDYSKFDRIVDLDGLKKDMAENKKGGYEELPDGTYDVALMGLELGETGDKSKNPGSPMVKAKFEVLAGDHADRWIFMNQVVSTGAGLGICLHFIRSMIPDNGKYVELRDAFHPDYFSSYGEFGKNLEGAGAFIKENFEFALKVSTNSKGFKKYEIVEVYDLNEEEE